MEKYIERKSFQSRKASVESRREGVEMMSLIVNDSQSLLNDCQNEYFQVRSPSEKCYAEGGSLRTNRQG